jgi:outer membrane protein assembly factor BamB
MRGQILHSILSVLLFAAISPAQEWPRFRGPNGSGISPRTFPTHWTNKDYRWQVKLPGPGHSSPVVWGDRLYVTSAGGKDTLHVLCLDTASGRTLWNKAILASTPRGHKDNNLASATPAVDGRRVYLAWGTPQEVVLLALDGADGKEVWRAQNLGPYRAGHGFGASPIVHDGLVILPCEQAGKDCLVAVDAATGKERWRAPRKSRNTYATPCVLQPPGRAAELVAVSYEDGITGLDPATGRLLWEVDAFDKRHIEGAIASPIVHDDLVLATAGWLGVRYETIALRRAEPRKGPGNSIQTLYKLDRGAPLVPTPVVKGGLVFLWQDRGVVSCHDAATGAPFWSERVEGGFYASPVVAGKYLYCPSRDGDMVVLAASKQFERVAVIPLGEGTHATPAIAGGRLFVRTFTKLMCLEAMKGVSP